MSYILAIDQGTSSCRTIIFDEKANIISKSQKLLSQLYLKYSWNCCWVLKFFPSEKKIKQKSKYLQKTDSKLVDKMRHRW